MSCESPLFIPHPYTKNNHMQIRIDRIPHGTSIIDLPAGSTIQDALNGADITLRSAEMISINNTLIMPVRYASFTLSEDTTIRIMSQVKGN